MSKYISVRVPKKAAEKNFQCAIQVRTLISHTFISKNLYICRTRCEGNFEMLPVLIIKRQNCLRKIKMGIDLNVQVELKLVMALYF